MDGKLGCPMYTSHPLKIPRSLEIIKSGPECCCPRFDLRIRKDINKRMCIVLVHTYIFILAGDVEFVHCGENLLVSYLEREQGHL